MYKRIWTLLAVAAGAGTTAVAAAQDRTLIHGAGCAALSEAVRQSMRAAIVSRPDRIGDRVVRTAGASNGTLSCGATAAAVSYGFTAALAQSGISISWDDERIEPPEYCLSHDLRQCFPFPRRAAAPVSAAELAFVQNAWAGVSRRVSAKMPWGTASDMSTFEASSLTRELAPAGRDLRSPR